MLLLFYNGGSSPAEPDASGSVAQVLTLAFTAKQELTRAYEASQEITLAFTATQEITRS